MHMPSWLHRLLPFLADSADAPQWSDAHITDEWFRAHFTYAADVVAKWIGPERIRGARMLDFGAGDGITLLGLMLRHGLGSALGVDISTTHKGLLALARKQIGLRRLPRGLTFERIAPGAPFACRQAPVPLIMSWSTFEHVPLAQMNAIFTRLRELLAEDGRFFLQINPLFYSPFGAHLSRFGLPPWAHLLWSEAELEQAVHTFAGDIPPDEMEENFFKRSMGGYKQFVLNEYRALNRITADELTARLQQAGFTIEREQRAQVDLTVPPELLERFAEADLRVEEIRLLMRRS